MQVPFELLRSRSLPAPRPVEFVVESVESEPGGFLRRISRRLRVAGDGLPEAARQSFPYDEVDRRCLDAVVVLPHFLVNDEDGGPRRYVVLRTAARPPVLLRDPQRFRGHLGGVGVLWEAPAGLVEPEEESDTGLRACAARELAEETGFVLRAASLVQLGPPTYPCPGVIGERQYYFAADVTDAPLEPPGLDGSPLEAIGEIIAVPLDRALTELERHGPVDLKTEVALRRLIAALAAD